MQENKQEKSLIKQNILSYLKKKGITPYECYKKTGITRGVLTQNNGITEENILKFLAFYSDVDVTWLITGRDNTTIPALTEKGYNDSEKIQVVEETYNCPRCEVKQARIDKLTQDLLEAKDELIAILKGEQKNERTHCG